MIVAARNKVGSPSSVQNGQHMRLLGCIADDFSGATDLCSSLTRAGCRCSLFFGVPTVESAPRNVDAIVVALKTRSVPPAEATETSLGALAALRAFGVEQFIFKYCSTFDSTPQGNIGPVLDALSDALDLRYVIVCPAHPEQARTVYLGHLFVGEQLLSESPMAHHPVNPMRDSNLLRLLRSQTERAVGLVPYMAVASGADTIRAALEARAAAGDRYLVVDAVEPRHLMNIALACHDLALLSGGAGIGAALASCQLGPDPRPARPAPVVGGPIVLLAGSSSLATRKQVEMASRAMPARKIDVVTLADGSCTVDELVDWAVAQTAPAVLLYATDKTAQVKANQRRLGVEKASQLVEDTIAAVARNCRDRGVRRFFVAGGETSGAVVRSLGIRAARVHNDLQPGVPWLSTSEERPLVLALKSGNFGSEDIMLQAARS